MKQPKHQSYCGIAGLKDYYKAQGADVIMLDAGDFSQGSTLVSYYKGKNAGRIHSGRRI